MSIHPVCRGCKKPCKQPWSFWDPQLPPWEYCEQYEPIEGRCERCLYFSDGWCRFWQCSVDDDDVCLMYFPRGGGDGNR